MNDTNGLRQVDVIVIDWNTPDLAIRAARSAVASRGISVKVTLVDNGCDGDHTVAFNDAFRGDAVAVLRSPRNLGFAGAVNAAIRRAERSPDAIVLLNSDAVVDPLALRALVEPLTDPVVGAAAPAVWIQSRRGRRLEGFGHRIDWWRGRATFIHRGAPPGRVPLDPFPGEWLSGACLALKPDALADVGLFDESYFAYFEETDWCVRASRRGWRLLNVPAASAEHIGGMSSTCALRLSLLLRNNVLFMRKLAPRRHLLLFLVYWWCVQVPNLARWCITSDTMGTLRGIFTALIWNATRRVRVSRYRGDSEVTADS